MNTKNCPYCKEEIKRDAIKCRFCMEFLDRNESKTSPNKEKKKNSTNSKKYVICEACDHEITSKPSNDFYGFHTYTCLECQYKNRYPLDNTYEIIYTISFLFFFGLLFLSMFDGGIIYCSGIVGILGVIAIPLLIINSSIKNKIPDYKEREFNSNNS